MASFIAEKKHGAIDSLAKRHARSPHTVPVSFEQNNNLHLVDRNGVDYPEQICDGLISGYDSIPIGARTALSSDEGKKLLSRIDWHLISLLAVIYMLKSVNFTNVSLGHNRRLVLLMGLFRFPMLE
jgi:hypothetical protein